jgi:glycosyltransferase involved in cell wall biosynthesis
MKQGLWVVIPAFNEGEVIAGVVAQVRASYPNIVVVDDCSSDNTSALAREALAHVVRHPINLGQGAALQTGIAYALEAGASCIITFDADGQHQVEDIATLLHTQAQTEADIVVGSRFLGKSTNLPAARRLVLKMAVVFSRITSGVNLTDAHNGLRLITRTTALRLRIRQNRMAHASELVNEIGRLKLKVAEAPVTIVYTEYSLKKGQKLSNAFNIVAELFVDKISR